MERKDIPPRPFGFKPSAQPIWIVDDDHSIRWVLEEALKSEGLDARIFSDAEVALDAFNSERPKIVVTDIRMPGISGMDLLEQIHERAPELPVIVMTAYSDLDTTVESFQRGAREYLSKPFDIDEAVSLIRRVMSENGDDEFESDADVQTSTTIIGSSLPMQEMFRAVGRLSKSDLNVLITGESGTGKELVARALYENSIRKNRPFVAINAAAIPADLLESELFGHEKGSFTGANQRRIGRFEQADRGTLFLDEIGDMPHDLQSRLLRVLSEGRFYRVGGVNQITVDVRVIAATNQNLEQLIDQRKFRSDLYHRLNVVQIRLAPVRERTADIPQLVRHFLRKAAEELNTEEKIISKDAMNFLVSYDWPGNVREIENICRTITVMTASRHVDVSEIPLNSFFNTFGSEAATETSWESALRAHAEALLDVDSSDIVPHLKSQFDRSLLEAALVRTNYSRRGASKLLGWSRNTVARKIKELGIEDEPAISEE